MQVLFRRDFDSDNELAIARQYCNVKEYRSECSDKLIVGRYSVLPYYRELEKDLASKDSKLVNSYRQHRWIANFDYYDALKQFTFPTWTDDDFYLCKDDGPFVVKGRTNSRKHQWKTHMFAKDKHSASCIGSILSTDALIGEQGILYRKYVPLETFEIGINDIPFTNEWRLFFFKHNLLTYGYYWSQADKADEYRMPDGGLEFAKSIANIAKDYVNFFVLDIAKTQEGNWILIEVNDGQMSGLSMCNPHELYKQLDNRLKE